jgi:hypothetical protein
MRTGRFPKFLLVGGIVLTVVGGAVVAFVPTKQFGWFAYAPLSESVFTLGVVLGTAHLWGAAAGAVGLVLSSWAAGYVAGRRAQRQASATARMCAGARSECGRAVRSCRADEWDPRPCSVSSSRLLPAVGPSACSDMTPTPEYLSLSQSLTDEHWR